MKMVLKYDKNVYEDLKKRVINYFLNLLQVRVNKLKLN